MNAVEIASDLIRFDSVSAKTNGPIADYIDAFLQKHGFEVERIPYEHNGVTKVNVIARYADGRYGTGNSESSGGLAYFGHTDVVPVEDWRPVDHGPFDPHLCDGKLYGRGSTDMKGSVACMLAAIESTDLQTLKRPLYISCSADEEIGHLGILEVIKRSELFGALVTDGAFGVVGEPTNMQVIYAHKGGIVMSVTSRGMAAHSSSDDGVNANMKMIPFLQEIKSLHDETQSDNRWTDERFAPPTMCMNIGINDHTHAVNIKPAESVCTICVRPMPNTDSEELVKRIHVLATQHDLEFELLFRNPPFFCDPQSPKISDCIKAVDHGPAGTVGFGSEACNLTALNDLVVLGPGNIAQAHKSDEWISVDQLNQGWSGYQKLITKFCSD